MAKGSTRLYLPPGSTANFQLRAWEVNTGASWNEAIHRGESDIAAVQTGDPTTIPPGSPAVLPDMSFDMYVVPEPCTTVLGLLAATMLFCAQRCLRR